jgi:uncharacterized membrane protein YjgN (DUF898 family)
MNQIIAADFSASSIRPVFSNRRSAFRRLVMRGAMLELVTVGFYRFWLATDMRRHMWSHTSIAGDAAEYTGTAKELLIGFLFAMAILAPLYLIYFLAGLEAERLKTLASVPLGLFFYVFMQFAIYRARRYRLTRTVWRGVRFSMVGSGLSYAWRSGLWSLLVAMTLGLALPWRQAALERFKMRHTSYGDLQGRFDGKGWELFKRGWWLWLAVWLIFIVPIAAAVAMASLKLKQGAAIAYVVMFLLFFSLPFIYAAYKAIEWRWWLSGIRFGAVTFESDLKRRALIGPYWKVIGWAMLLVFVLSVLLGIVFGIAMTLVGDGTPAERAVLASQHLPVLISAGVSYVVAALAFGVVIRMYLMHDVWQRVTGSVTVNNLAAAADVTAQGQLVGALGEGFADSLDVVGF